MLKNLTKTRKVLIYSLLALCLVFLAIVFTKIYISPKNPNRLLRSFQSTLIEKEKEVDDILLDISEKFSDASIDSIFYHADYSNLYTNKGFVILVFDNDSLIYWSDNSVPVYEKFGENNFDLNFLRYSNGWFNAQKIAKGSYSYVGLIKIKSDFIYQNEFLNNNFQGEFNLPNEISISVNRGENEIFDKDGNYLFSLVFPNEYVIQESHIIILTLFYLLSFIFIIVALYKTYQHFLSFYKNRVLLSIGFVIDILIIRFVIFYFEIPRILYSSRLFSPEEFANSVIFPSLGDLLVNSIVILAISFIFYTNIKVNSSVIKNKSRVKYLTVTGILVFVFVLFQVFSGLLGSLVINSSISFNLNNITSISYYSIIGLVCFGLITLSFVFITVRILQILAKSFESPLHYFGLIALSGIVIFFISKTLFSIDIFKIIFLIFYIGSFWFITRSKAINIRFSSTIFYLILFSILSTYILYKSENASEKEKRKILAQKFAKERDPVAEYLFSNISNEIKSDTILEGQIKNISKKNEPELDNVIDYVKKTYFSDYWNKYDFLITICDSTRILDIQPEDYLVNCFEYFNEITRNYGSETGSKNLYYLDYDFTSDNYLGIIDYENYGIRIYIEFFSKYIPKGLGYPELLIDKYARKSSDLSNYSWARYEEDELVYHFGKYFYSMNLTNYVKLSEDYVFFHRNKYSHLFYRISQDKGLIISKKRPGIIDVAAPFSYIFIFYGILYFISVLIFRRPLDFRLLDISFKKRLQLSITALIIASFIFVGIVSLFYIITQNDNKNHDILSEKAHSVLIELEHKLAAEESLSYELEEYLSELLYKFSLVFFSDINLYDLNGTLLATSRPEIFTKGLISTKMNSEAYNNMSTYRKSLYIHDESIGDYNFLSAYLPFRNEQNNLIAYLNLPYFAKQDELTNEISTFLVAFVNIYVILIAIAIFIALVIANYVTKPLQFIKEKISRLKLGRTNEKIEWGRRDEIGSLVVEYNRMVDELANSAELLAKSERESAWREMAKQIAHEIKNPLTPMKLSVQYLQKAYNEKTPDWDKKLKRFTQTIIEQIDSLSIIATEFSDFAKMPRSKFDRIELTEVIKNALGLFKNITEISFNADFQKKYYVLADKEQILRVFNNLIKNSIHAIADPAKGLISISIEEIDNNNVIRFTDNGKGIPEEERVKVFYPNFTTKSSGMGLGLAVVKNIIQNSDGEITFESKVGEGTTFIISLPVYRE